MRSPQEIEQTVRHRNDLETLSRPHTWPHVRHGAPVIFVKRRRRGETTQTGPCICLPGKLRVLAHDWGASPHDRVETIDYSGAEAMVAAGWIVGA